MRLPAAEPSALTADTRKAAAIAFARIFIGVFWLFEVTVGHNWKIGGFASGANPDWVGPGAGEAVRGEIAEAISDGTYAWAGWLFDTVLVPNAAAFGYLTIALQVLLGVAFIVGFAVRPLALAAIAMDVSIFMLGNSRVPPFFTAAHLFLLVSGAGAYYGLDGWILERTAEARSGAARALRWLIDLPVFRRSWTVPAIAAASVIALFFFLTMPTRDTRFAYVAMDLAALAGLVALGLYAAARLGDRFSALAAALRIFVGYKFLHEIWSRTDPGVNALPGFAGADAQAEVWQQVVDNHWALFAWFTDTLILPNMGFWVVLFAAVQLAVGVSLVIGYRTRLAGIVGLAYLGVLIALGMTRYAPFVFGLLIPVIALDGGRVLSLDRVRRPAARVRYGLPIPTAAVPVLIALAAVNAAAATVVAFTLGIVPDAYVESMPAMVTAFVAIFSGLLALVGWLQRHPHLDHSGEAAGREVERVAQPHP
jgi:hypothetical protein